MYVCLVCGLEGVCVYAMAAVQVGLSQCMGVVKRDTCGSADHPLFVDIVFSVDCV